MNTLLVAIHGILTRQTNPSWPDQLDVWLSRRHPDVRALKKEYTAGPFPRWNCWFKNPRLCRGLAAEIELFLQTPPQCESPQVWIVAHSNGALIALGTVNRLLALGHSVAGIILVGAACTPDVEQNHVLKWVTSGRLGRAIAYCSAEDHVLPGGSPGAPGVVFNRLHGALAWPYGNLGRTGWTLGGKRLLERTAPADESGCPRILTRWFTGGHSGYFSPDRIEYTFRQVTHDARCD